MFVNVFGGITSCDAVANGIVKALQMLGSEANKPLVVRPDGNNVEEGRRILAEANHPVGRRPTPWTPVPTRPPTRRTPPGRTHSRVDFLNKDLQQDHRPGITGGEGTKHTALMLQAGSQVVGGVNARKAGTPSRIDSERDNDKSPGVRVGGRGDGQNRRRRVDRLRPPAFTKDAIVEAIDAEIPSAGGHHRGNPRCRTPPSVAYNVDTGNKTRIIGPNCPGIITPDEALVGITRTPSPARARSAWCPSPAR